MRATGEIQLIPVGTGTSLREPIQRARTILEETGLKVDVHAQGTNVEGELEDILAGIKRLHETLHAEGIPRLSTSIKLGTRTDKESSLEDKERAVKG